MIDYFLVFVASFLGVAYDVMSNIKRLRGKFPEAEKGVIVNTFFAEEWDSLLWSVLVAVSLQLGLFICRTNEVIFASWFENWGMYVFSLIAGYGGQRIAFRFLTTAEKVLNDKVDKMGGN